MTGSAGAFESRVISALSPGRTLRTKEARTRMVWSKAIRKTDSSMPANTRASFPGKGAGNNRISTKPHLPRPAVDRTGRAESSAYAPPVRYLASRARCSAEIPVSSSSGSGFLGSRSLSAEGTRSTAAVVAVSAEAWSWRDAAGGFGASRIASGTCSSSRVVFSLSSAMESAEPFARASAVIRRGGKRWTPHQQAESALTHASRRGQVSARANRSLRTIWARSPRRCVARSNSQTGSSKRSVRRGSVVA